MLKFATKKPPRLKHSDQVKTSAPLDNHGRVFIDDSSSYLTGNYTRFERINGDDMIDSDHQKVEYIRSVQDEGPEYLENKENGRDQIRGRTVSPANVHWKAYNVKYGKVGVEKELDFSDTSPVRQVGMSRNTVGTRSGTQQVDQGQRSQVNPGYIDNTLENRKPYDVNRNFNQEGMYNSRNYSKGSGYHFPPSGGHYDEARSHDNERSRSHGYGHDYNGNQQHQVHTQRLQHENPFPAPSFSTDSNGTPYCADSMGSMSIDSLSTSGDRSSKSVSETPDYDVLIDLPQHTKHGLDMKPPVHHKHRHVHIGRGTHGVCEGSVSPTRPGSSECSMTSSLRKSPSGMKSGHHVRWGPGVVNSHAQPHEAMQRSRGQGQIQSQYAAPPVSKKSKKKSSLRSLLNLPKFPLSDDESTDSTLDGQGPPRTKKEYNGTSENVAHRGTLRKLLDYRPRKRATQLAVSQPVVTTELASLKYKRDYQHGDSSITASDKALGQRPPLTKLNITEANSQYPLNYDYEYLEPMDSISYPIMHSGKDSSIFRNENLNEIKIRPDTNNRSPVNSVRPFLINGQSSEIQDYDYFTDRESKPQTSEVISVNLNDKTEVNALHQARVSVPQSYDIQTRTTNVLQTTPPFATATFDTYVTLGRPNESSVTFDTFVTHGRPYATSTPIPNGSIANTSNVSQDYLSRGAGDFSDPRRVNIHSSGLSGTSGHIGANVTQTWNYSVPGSQHSTAPMATHSVWTRSKESAMHPGSHTGMTSVARSPEGPYDLENRVYGKLSPPSSYITSSGDMGVHVTQSTNFGNNSNVLDLLGQRSGSQTVSDKQIENMQFKDTCKYREKDTGDYDDDVFLNLGLNPNVIGKSGAVRRKLDFAEENSAKVVTSCVPQLNHDLNQDDTLNHNYSGFPKVQVVPGIAQQRGTMSSNLNDNEESGEVACILDLVYITERIISMSFASEEHDNTYKYNLKEVTRMLKTKHGENYLVINISEKKPDLAKHCPQVFDYGWPDNLAPPLERLCGICKAIDQWMSTDPNHVVVVHCKGGRGRIAVVIAAYMRYSNICASADQALDRFAMKRFYDDKLGGLPQPSQRRYVHYFAGLLSGAIQINSSALYLHHILIHGVPNFDTRGGCRPFIKVYQGMHPIFTSGVYNVTDNMQKVCISISPGIPLRGDILIKCYHKKNNAGQREMMWGCQFHTCAISHNSLVFSKNELDFAIGDPRFPEPGKVEFVFGNNSEGLVQVADFKSDVTVPVDDTTEGITRWDSYENFGKSADGKETDVNANGLQSSHQQQGVDNFRVTQLDHSQGPVDGSLYAQISKRKLESQIIQNGSTKLQNGGSYSSSIDSVPMGTSTTHKSSSESWSYNKSERDFHQPNLSHSSMNKSYSSSTSPRSGKVALDEQTQLDQILSDLLNDQAFVSQKSAPGTRSFKTVEEHRSPEGNVVVQRGDVTYKLPEVRTEKHYTVKTETKTLQDDKYKPVNAFTYTPSSPEMSRSFEPLRSPQSPKAPNRSDYEKNYKKESYNYQSNGPSSLSDGEQSLSWLQQQQAKMREKSTERDPNRQRNEQMLIQELKKSQTQNKYYQKHTQSEDESSTKVASPLQNGPASPYSYTVSRTHTYNTEKSPTENGFRPHDTLPVAASHTTYITEQSSTSKVSNKPPPSPNLQRTVTPTLNSPPVPPPQRTSSRDYMQHQTQHQTQQQQTQQTRNRTYSGGAYQQSSSSWKGETHTQPRVIQRHNSESAYDRDHYERQERQHESRQQFKTPPLSPRSVSPHTFQTYKTVYKTIHHDEPDFSQPQPVEVKFEKQTQKEQQTVQDVNKPHYITEVIVQRTGGSDSKNSTLSRSEREKQETDNRLEALEKSLQAASHSIMASTPWQQQQQLQQQQQQQLQQQQNVIKQEVRQFETRSYETKTEQRQEQRHEQQRVSREDVNGGGYPRSMSPVWDNFPTEHIQQSHSEAPKKIEITEEDRITLKPIGPGVQQLEPEGSIHSTSTLGRDSTLGRATTPNFPTSPSASAEHIIQAVHEKARRMSIGSSNQSLNSIGGYLATPPFPVTPRTPYTNISAATSQYHPQGYAAPRSQQSPFGFGSSTRSLGPYSSQQSLNSVFEREETDRDRYNTIVSRQLMHSAHDPTYASITDTSIGNAKAGGNLVSPTGTLQSDKMQFQNQYQQHQSYQTSTLPHSTSGPVSQPFQTNTLPHQTSLNQQQLQQQQLQQQQQQQQQFQQRQYQTYQSSSSQQHHHTQQYSSSNTHQDGSLQIDTNPRMLMTQPARSPSSPGSPPSPGNLNTLRQQLHVAHNMSNSAVSPGPHSATGQSSPSVYFGLSRRGSLTSLADTEAVHTTPRFVKDTSKYWYKPNISREEAIIMLKDKAPGTFVVRDSNSFPGAFGLALKVATLPPNVQTKSTGDPQADLVRHFLIEPTSKGVRLRGCSNEPVFGSLASLVYQHSITPLALPCKLVLPEHDSAHIVSESSSTLEMPNSASQLLSQGAACNVVYLNSVDTESLTGPQAVAKACKVTYDNPPPKTTHVHFKVSNQGITLTDNQRKLFFRRHYPVAAVTYCGGDPEDRKWKRDTDVPGVQADSRVFGFVARKQGSISDNCCHLFAELDPDQPASAIVNFVTKVMIGQGKIKS